MGLGEFCQDRKLVGIRDVYAETLIELARDHEDIVVLDADLSSSTRTGKFGKEYRDRFFNMGISEQDMIGTAAGLALVGKIPFASTFAIFEAGRAWEQIRLSLCLNRLPVKLVASHGGLTVGEDGPTHHCTEDIALMRVLPNMTVVLPMDANEMRAVIRKSLLLDGPLYIRGSRENFPLVNPPDVEFEFGKGRTLMQGNDITIIACGLMVDFSLQAARALKADGVGARVINMSTIKPLDKEIVTCAARETGLIMTVEEHSIVGGLGSAVCETLCESSPVPVKRMGTMDQFAVSGCPCRLLDMYGLTPKAIAENARALYRDHKG